MQRYLPRRTLPVAAKRYVKWYVLNYISTKKIHHHLPVSPQHFINLFGPLHLIRAISSHFLAHNST